jgi:hypothetical protein
LGSLCDCLINAWMTLWLSLLPMAQDRLRNNNNKNPNHNLTKFPSVIRNGVRISPVRERPGKDPNGGLHQSS